MEKRAFDLPELHHGRARGSGCLRRQAIEAAGGITADTVAEDADLHHRDSPAGLARHVRRVCDCLDRSSGNARVADSAALSLDVWDAAILLEAQQHIVPGEVWRARWVALPNIFVFQIALPLISPVIDLLFLGSLLLWGLAQLHITQDPAPVDHGGRAAFGDLLPGIPDH